MLALTKLTNPGPFGSRTHEMGDYFGIRIAGTLAAMVGERLKLPGYTEISAVCTHPDHLGHGYASVLIAKLVDASSTVANSPSCTFFRRTLAASKCTNTWGWRNALCCTSRSFD
jgi:predicted GNAT family acetyltransferase